MVRHCARPACGDAAEATLSYDYSGRTVWLDQLSDEHEPYAHDLCVAHADRLSVPRGWSLQDRRPAVARLLTGLPSTTAVAS